MAEGLKATILTDLGQASEDAGDNLDRAGEYTSNKIDAIRRLLGPAYVLNYNDGKAVQEILNRYVNEELRPRIGTMFEDEDYKASLQKDIDYITELAKLFD